MNTNHTDRKTEIEYKIKGLLARKFFLPIKNYQDLDREEKDFINFVYTDKEIFGEIRESILNILNTTKNRISNDINPEFELIILCIKCRERLVKKLSDIPSFTITDSELINYLFKSAHNRRRKLELTGKRMKKVASKSTLEDENYKLHNEKSFMKKITCEIMKELIMALKKLIRDKDFELLELKFFEGYSYKKIGEILEVNENTARKKKFDIIRRCKYLLGEYEKFTQGDFFDLLS